MTGALAAPARRRTLRLRLDDPVVGGLFGILATLASWTLVAWWLDDLVPTPLGVVRATVDDWSIIAANSRATMHSATLGWIWGNGAAIALAAIVALVPAIERPVLRASAMIYCLPALAIGPILQVLLNGDNPKIALAALSVFFTTLVGAVVGLSATPAATLDVVSAAGGGRWRELRIARVRSALPSLFASMRIAGPAAVLGAILGEYLGGADGLGPAMVNAQTQLMVERTWALGLAATVLAGAAYAVAVVLGRLTCPWAGAANAESVAVDRGRAAPRRGVRGVLGGLTSLLVSLIVVVGLWWGLIIAFGLDPLVAKTPADVWRFLVTDPSAAASRGELFAAMGTTLRSAAIGYVAGTVVAVLLVAGFVRWRALEYAGMPAAVILQSVPLSVFTPVFIIIFGRGSLSTAFICGAVTFFPTLVMTLAAVRSMPTAILDVFDAVGATDGAKLRKAQLPAALPAILAAGRVAVPRAVIGALLVEWLATGRGIGYLMLRSTTTFEYTRLWSAVVVCTLTMILLYTTISTVESLVLARLGGNR